MSSSRTGRPLMLIDISRTVDDRLPLWPGSPGWSRRPLLSIDRGDRANASELTLDLHTGTHVDAPRHFVPGGATVESLDLDLLIGPALVIDTGEADSIGPAELEAAASSPAVDRLLLRTRNSIGPSHRGATFDPGFASLSPQGACWVVDHGIGLVGIDYLSIQRWDDPDDTHLTLLGAGVIVIEGLDLSAVEAGQHELICLPILLPGAEAAPARALLRVTT